MGIKNKNVKIITVLVLLFAGIIGAVYVLSRDSDSTVSEAASSSEPVTTSTLESAQETFTVDDGRTPVEPSPNTEEAKVTDNNGKVTVVPDETQWLVSNTGEITVYSPLQNASVGSDFTLSGSSKLSEVTYRLMDNVSGVIATGTLAVVGGQYSGDVAVKTNGTEGRLDVFATANDGTEFSVVEVLISYE